jgi:hypothetical protein
MGVISALGQPNRLLVSSAAPPYPNTASLSHANRKEIAMPGSLLDNQIGTVEIDGRELAKLRKIRGHNAAELGEKAGVGQSTIEKWEARGVGPADVDCVRRIVETLEIEPEALLTEACCQELQQKLSKMGAKAQASVHGTQRQLDSSPPTLFQLPSLLSDFVSREPEVHEMVARLCSDGGCVGLSALKGMGGVGKTTLAVKVAHMVKDSFPDAQLMLNLQGVAKRPMTTVEAMTRIIRDFDPTIPNLPATEDELLPIYRNTLSGKRALIVLDNAAGESQVKNLVTVEKIGFIITSRNALALDGVASVRIDVFSPEKSLELVRSIVGKKGSNDELRTVSELCGYLPLALRVAGDFLRTKPDWTLANYIDALKQERLRWLKVGDDKLKNVDYVLKLSSAQLVRDNCDLALRWHYLARWPADFVADAAAAAWKMDPKDHTFLEDLTELVRRSLVLFDEKSSRYRLHDLMKPIAKGLFAGGFPA